MARKIRVPKYPARKHSSGQARIRLAGRAIYLGRFGSPESIEKYHRLVAEHLAGVETVPNVTGKEITVA